MKLLSGRGEGKMTILEWIFSSVAGYILLILLMIFVGGLVHQSRESARRQRVKNNMMQLGLALEAYHKSHPESLPASESPVDSINEK